MRVRLHLPSDIEATILQRAAERGLSATLYVGERTPDDEPTGFVDDFIVVALAFCCAATGFALGILVAGILA